MGVRWLKSILRVVGGEVGINMNNIYYGNFSNNKTIKTNIKGARI